MTYKKMKQIFSVHNTCDVYMKLIIFLLVHSVVGLSEPGLMHDELRPKFHGKEI